MKLKISESGAPEEPPQQARRAAEQFIFAVKGTPDTSIGGTAGEIELGLRSYGFSVSTYTSSYFDFSKLVRNTDQGKPVIGSGYTNGYNHAYVYIGYQYEGTMPLDGKVIIHDSSLGMRMTDVFRQQNTGEGYYSEHYIIAS